MVERHIDPLPEGAHEARYWHTEDDERIVCTLCPRLCKVKEGQAGFCFIRQNHGGKLYNIGYGRPSGFAADPIEKKPLSHFLPGSSVLSFGTVGCNLGCKFCQNWDISKAREKSRLIPEVTPEQVVALARREDCASIAYTYNDPVIFAEFVEDVAREARGQGIRSVAVTAGYITEEARPEFYENIDAANVDLKAFTDDFYRKVTLSELEPVLETLKWIKHESDVWLEITNLIIPGYNDDPGETRKMAEWILENLGPDVPVHFTAFHPDYKFMHTRGTPPEMLSLACRIARDVGLHYVYTGNVHDPAGGTTFCPGCAAPLVVRDWHRILKLDVKDGKCPHCEHEIAGVWELPEHDRKTDRPRRVI
ncbi:MAG: AmmeMemoRadiSam system radical SAM enzyme [Chrysiogenetes bacterium]|nr:AmmeMemoRadiSam system radical SAM enzyme [Chrysiogenetes bacterium]